MKWTDDLDALLKTEWAGKATVVEMLPKFPGRSGAALSARARALGLPKRPNSTRRRGGPRPWAGDEDEMLLDLWAKRTGLSEISRILRRSITSVDWRLMVLGAKKMSEGKVKAEPKITTTKRPCLRCGHSFASEGKHNRICGRCKSGSIWRSGGDYEARI